ncbi:hypothetical protein [Holdemanella porci]|uniref:hypothetical protein n=1 Tax=Holdemanella porci TaxID=2652276 RepID=UPI002FD98FC7
MDCNVAENINILAKFLGTRDIDALNQEELFNRYGIHQVDVMVLFGGSILEGGDVLASGIKNFVAKKIYYCWWSRTYNRYTASGCSFRISGY